MYIHTYTASVYGSKNNAHTQRKQVHTYIRMYVCILEKFIFGLMDILHVGHNIPLMRSQLSDDLLFQMVDPEERNKDKPVSTAYS